MIRIFCAGALTIALFFSMACGKRGGNGAVPSSGHRARVVLEVNPPPGESDAGMDLGDVAPEQQAVGDRVRTHARFGEPARPRRPGCIQQ